VVLGALALAAATGLTACGDKITNNPTPVDSTIHSVTVSPPSLTLKVGDVSPLSASVSAGPGAKDKTVKWTSGNAAVATVDANGVVTAKGGGNTTVTATSNADPSVSGAAAISVGQTAPASVTISTINQGVNNCGATAGLPANLTNACGQLDVTLNVDPGSGTLAGVDLIMNCTGNGNSGQDTVVASQGSAASNVTPMVSDATAPVTLSVNTAAFNATTGVVSFRNAPCIMKARARLVGSAQTATTSTAVTLNNIDGVVVTTTTSGPTANDVNGLPWKGGNVTVAALPVLYSGRTPANVSITFPGASNTATQLLPASATGATTATWSATAGSGPRVKEVVAIGGYDANGFPTLNQPIVLVIDSQGNDVSLATLNTPTQSGVRLDNKSPDAPTVFTIPTPVSGTNGTGRQGWANAAYTFSGAANRYTSGGDAGVSNGSAKGAPGIPGVPPADNAGVSGNTGLNGQTTITYFSAPAASYTNVGGAAGPSTDVGTSGNCATTGLTQITTAGDLAATVVNTAYKVRINETDKLGNVRCTDLGAFGAPVQTTFGVDKGAPTAVFDDPNTPGGLGLSAPDHAQVNAASPAIQSWSLVINDPDGASLFMPTGGGFGPARTLVIRQYPGISVAQSCVIGSLDNSGACTVTNTTGTNVFVNGTGAAVNNAGTVPPNTEGYYTLTTTVNDRAQNSAPTLTRTAVVDITLPTMGGVGVPATIIGGAAATFSASATDNLDLATSNYTLSYGTPIANPPAGSSATFDIRAAGPNIGQPFSGTLTTSASFSVVVAQFIRNVQVTNGTDNPVALANPANQPSAIAVTAIDAAGNPATNTSPIAAANVPQTNATSYATSFTGTGTWLVTNTNPGSGAGLCNASPCTTSGAVTSVTLTASASGPQATFQTPFTQVQFYFFDVNVHQWVFIGNATNSGGTTSGGNNIFTYALTGFSAVGRGQPSAAAINILALGVNAAGDALASRANGAIMLVP
jgi:hypothetical protein